MGIGYFYGKNDKNQRIYNLIAKHPVYREFLTCPFIHKLCSIYFNRDTFHDKYGLNSFSANIIHSGGSEGAWHLDSVLPDPIPVKYPIRLQIIISLDEFTKLNGSTAVAPGSHKFGRRPNDTEAKELGKGYLVECPPGSLLLFNSNTWHKNTANQSPNSRFALLASFAASYFMEVCGEEEHLSIISENLKKELHPRLQQMIGYKRAIKKAAIFN